MSSEDASAVVGSAGLVRKIVGVLAVITMLGFAAQFVFAALNPYMTTLLGLLCFFCMAGWVVRGGFRRPM